MDKMNRPAKHKQTLALKKDVLVVDVDGVSHPPAAEYRLDLDCSQVVEEIFLAWMALI